MPQISNIILPDNTMYSFKGSIYTVIGTQTTNTAAWTGNLSSLKELYNGLTILYWLPKDSPNTNVTLQLTLKDGPVSASPCYYANDTRIQSYKGESFILLTYCTAGSIKINGTNISSDRWIAGATLYPNLTKTSVNWTLDDISSLGTADYLIGFKYNAAGGRYEWYQDEHSVYSLNLGTSYLQDVVIEY